MNEIDEGVDGSPDRPIDTADRQMNRFLRALPAGVERPEPEGSKPVVEGAASRDDSVAERLAQLMLGGRDGFVRSTVEPALPRGRILGRYVVLATLGRGGMGTVLKAYDESLDRAIAIKLLHPEAVERHALRLRREAQALAKLSHPNIVHVYEVGESDGQWFIAMELVPGQTLRQWQCAEPRTWREHVKAYLQAGEGLAAAHAAGLVHRDFKPDNCIIDGKGRARVLDFGLAGSTATRSDDGATEDGALAMLRPKSLDPPLTSTGTVMGTPAYMPPEQMDGLEADARSDQFSFCVSLYEAVYGERPFAGGSLIELSLAMADQSVRPPPKGTRVPTELRRILVQGLAVDPTKRWPSMDALLDALRPLAAPRRGRWIAVSVGVGLVAVGAGLAMGELVDRLERCTGARAELDGIWDGDRRRAVESAILGTRLSYAADTWERVHMHLDEYSDAWVGKHTEICEATTVRGEQSAEVMDLRMGCLHDRKVALREAVNVLVEADATRVEKALSMLTALPGLSPCDDITALQAELPPPEDPEVAREVAALRERLAQARALSDAGDYDGALAETDAVVERAEALDYQPLLAEALARRSRANERKAEHAEAEADAERAYMLGVEHGDERVAMDAATTLILVVGDQQERHEAGLQWSKTALPLAKGRKGEPRDVARVLSLIGTVSSAQGKYAEALDHHQRALAIRQEALGPRHLSVAGSLNNVGNVWFLQGRLEEAFESFQQALDIYEEALGPRHPDVADLMSNIGNTRYRQGKHAEALDRYQRALAIQQEALGPRHPDVANSLNNVGLVLYEQRRYSEALDRYRRALAIREEALGPHHPAVADSLGNIAIVLHEQGQTSDALEHFQRGLAIQQEVLGPRHPTVAVSLNNIGATLASQGKPAEALEHYQRALVIQQEALGPNHPYVAVSLVNLGRQLQNQGQLEEALDHFQRALAIFQETSGPRHPNVAESLTNIGNVLIEQGKLEEALDRFQRALAIVQETLGHRHPDLADSLVGMTRVALVQRDHDAAREHAERALVLRESADASLDDLAEARFMLAQASWRNEHARARMLAEQARDAYVGLDAARQEELAEVERWLAEHRAR